MSGEGPQRWGWCALAVGAHLRLPVVPDRELGAHAEMGRGGLVHVELRSGDRGRRLRVAGQTADATACSCIQSAPRLEW